MVFAADLNHHLADTVRSALPEPLNLGTHLVLRVAKASSSISSPAAVAAFVTEAIHPLFPTRYLPQIVPVAVNAEFLAALDAESRTVRPEARSGSAIDTTQAVAILAPDYTRPIDGVGPTLCFEVKPKWLFVPDNDGDGSECSRPNQPGRTTTTNNITACRYCMHQHYKVARSESPGVSPFCPLDLLHADTVEHAVAALMACPGNNLRAWVDGTVLDLESLSSNDGALLHPWRRSADDNEMVMTSVLTRTLHALVPLFNLLAHHQRSLDSFDMADVERRYAEVAMYDNNVWERVVRQYRDRIDRETAAPEAEVEEASAQQVVAEYVLSMTVKDCSVLITVGAPQSQPHDLDDRGNVMVALDDGKCAVMQATLLDLDPKQFGKVPAWARLDRAIRACFAGVLRAREEVLPK
ncbi:inositol-pentakisphosphate 2-kinase [Blastocladiella britannica]|nr:inositol-pentakisphosphate 2-kinase [Blastocladiella britannica]